MKLTIKNENGYKFTNEQLGFKVHKVSVPEIISQQIVSDILPISHKEVVYDEVLQPRLITVQIGLYNDSSMVSKIVQVNELLCEKMTIMFDDGPLAYDVRITSFEQQEILGKYILFQLVFETLTAFRYSWQFAHEILEDDWNYETLGISEIDRSAYDLEAEQTIICSNRGQRSVYPVIKITGSFDSFSVGELSYNSSLTGVLIIDCERKICYQTSENGNTVFINQKANLSGEWIHLIHGQNHLIIGGANINVHIDIIYRHTFL